MKIDGFSAQFWLASAQYFVYFERPIVALHMNEEENL